MIRGNIDSHACWFLGAFKKLKVVIFGLWHDYSATYKLFLKNQLEDWVTAGIQHWRPQDLQMTPPRVAKVVYMHKNNFEFVANPLVVRNPL